MRRLLFVSAVLGLIAGLAQAQAPAPDAYTGPRLFVFGDSLSDNGNLFIANGGVYPNPSIYAWGRASNGPAWDERLGWALGNAPDAARLQAPWGGFGTAPQGWNFAHYGATVLNSGATQGQRLSAQVGYFARPDAAMTRFRAQDKITVWAGANDYLGFGATDTGLVTRTLAGQVRSLGQRGGKNMLVLNQPLWGNTPIGYERGDRNSLNNLMRAHNSALSTAVANLRGVDRLDAYYINIAALFTDVYTNPTVYGFSVVKPGTGTRGYCLGDGYGLSNCPRTYAFYDAIHPADSLHAVIGAYIGSQFNSIDARKLQGAQISQATANVLSLQAAIAMGKTVTGGFNDLAFVESGAPGSMTFAISETDVPGGALPDRLGGFNTGEFSLAGARLALGDGLELTAAVSSGLPNQARLSDFSDQDGESELMALTQTLGDYEFSVSAARSHQTATATRDTGFVYDPHAIAFLDQTQTLTLASIAKPFEVGAMTVTPDFSLGSATLKREAVQEFSPRGLAALNTGAASQKSAVYRASLSAAWHGKDARRSLGATLSTASTQADVVSAFTVLGIGDFDVRGELPVSEAVALTFEGTTPLADDWSLSLSGQAGQGGGETQSAARLTLSKAF